jgi:protein arginine N-methyltransferase 1
MGDVYSLRAFGTMIADAPRFSAYSQAIANAIGPGDIVLEIGCGPAVFALLACRAGARRVFAIDTADIVDFARKLAADNALADRVEFFQIDSRKLELPEPANVIVSDIRGALPFYGHAIAAINDARTRLLAPGGTMIPQRDTVKAALIDAADFYSRIVNPWQNTAGNLDFSASLPQLLNDSYGSHFKPEQLLSDPQNFCVLDYASGASERGSAELTFTTTRAGTAHGICLWFETRLFADIGYSTGPGAIDSVYSQIFLPWLSPVTLQQGEQVHVQLRADLIGSTYVWQWNTSIAASKDRQAIHYCQSTFHGSHLSPRFLRSRSADFTPELSPEGQADLFLLQSMTGTTPLREIAESATRKFPQVFASTQAAFDRAATLAEKLAR